MPGSTPEETRKFRFGPFEFDLHSGELRKHHRRIRLEGQPVQVLGKLLERPGELVTREELRRELWPADTFVNFEQSLNAAVKRLRQALLDSPQNPRFVETLARRGYRFVAAVETGGPAGAIDSLAVLPFENAAGDPESEYLSDGITESIINSLSRLPSVRVMARSTVFDYKPRGTGRKLNGRAVGRKLNVKAVLIGRILQRGDALSVGAELVEVRGGWQLWGEQYNRRLSDIFAVEEEIAREISRNLRVHLSGEDSDRLVKRHTRSTEAYQDYLKGRYHLNALTPAGLRQSIEYFEQAIGKDPNYALAYTGLADSYSLLGFFGLGRPAEVMVKAKEAAMKAVEIDAGLAEAHASLANTHKTYDWDWAAAEREYRKALELNPNYAQAHRMYAAYLAALDRPEEAMREIQLAHELDPLSLVIRMEIAWNLYMARDYDGAIAQAVHTLESAPDFASARHIWGMACQQKGRYEEAAGAYEKVHSASAGHAAPLAGLGHLLAATGRREEALAILAQLLEMASQTYLSPIWPAMVHAGLGQHEEALECLEKAGAERDIWLVWLKTEPRFDVLREEPRFQQLLLKVGLVIEPLRSSA